MVAVLGVRAAPYSVPAPWLCLWSRSWQSLSVGMVKVELALLSFFMYEVWIDEFVYLDIEFIEVFEVFYVVVVSFFHFSSCLLSVRSSHGGLPLNIGFPVLPQTQVFILS